MAGQNFYVLQNGKSKVLEIRKVLDFPSGKKYLIDVKKGVSFYTSKEEFYYVPGKDLPFSK